MNYFILSRRSGLLLLFILISLASFSFLQKTGILVKGELKNTEGASQIYLYEMLGSEAIKVDSTKNNQGIFTFNIKRILPRGFYKVGISEEKAAAVIIANENIDLKADLDQLPETIKVSGSKENAAFEKFNNFNAALNKQFQLLNDEAQNAQGFAETDPEKYQKIIQGLQLRADSLNKNKLEVYNSMIGANKGLFIEKYIKFFAFDAQSKENFFSPSDFSDPELARGDMLVSKISIYMQRFVEQDPQGWKQAAEAILQKATMVNSNKEVVYNTIIRNMANIDMGYAREVAKRYLKDFPKSKFALYLWDALPKEAPAIGEQAPEIIQKSPDGKMISLSSLRGKIVLLDFWASWCGPCRRENPNVVKAYNEFKDKGFTVYSVSLDSEREKWMRAIQADSLVWPNHVSDLKGWQSAAAKLYGVKGIPQTFLLDKNGNVIATNLRGEALEAKLQELLK